MRKKCGRRLARSAPAAKGATLVSHARHPGEEARLVSEPITTVEAARRLGVSRRRVLRLTMLTMLPVVLPSDRLRP